MSFLFSNDYIIYDLRDLDSFAFFFVDFGSSPISTHMIGDDTRHHHLANLGGGGGSVSKVRRMSNSRSRHSKSQAF